MKPLNTTGVQSLNNWHSQVVSTTPVLDFLSRTVLKTTIFNKSTLQFLTKNKTAGLKHVIPESFMPTPLHLTLHVPDDGVSFKKKC